MSEELAKQYEAKQVEERIWSRWLAAGSFRAVPDARRERFVVMMPLPNVTGALHMGHAMDNVMQDLLTRWHRMRGANTLWMAGTDHAGIATQAMVEKRLFELEGKTRNDIGREALVERIWGWKEQYQTRIVEQQLRMGCSCDWERQRFTMDRVCARAVRYTFFRMFRDGLIYRGQRLVNWDCHLQTAVADDEIVHETVAGSFWHIRYPVVDPRPGEPTHVVVATTRPETLLGDTAVAVHPDPETELERRIAEARERLAAARDRERAAHEAEVEALELRRTTHLPALRALAAMARDRRRVRLPLLGRTIPLITDTWAKPELGSGCVKITPGHDPNDYEVWRRHAQEIAILNILRPDGTLNENAGPYAGIERFAARQRVVADLRAADLLERVEDREIELGHSDRSKTPVEPYLSIQWFVQMGDIPGGVVCGRGTPREFRAPGLAQAAIDAVAGEWRSASGRKLVFHPDPVRYGTTYLNWLGEKRDWCISRQLWWGHQIPVWSARLEGAALARTLDALRPLCARPDVCVRAGGALLGPDTAPGPGEIEVQVCLLDAPVDEELDAQLRALGLERDPDVLDTWFSSGLWPHSTLGWPDPETAEVERGQLPLGSVGGQPSCLDYYYPGSCLVTGRDIITLWVARMVLMGLYNLGDLPFDNCFIHATIMDGKGERMSKSKGNGIDPVDICERYGTDAMRFVICELQTGTQDVRLPVQAISPFSGRPIELADAKRGKSVFSYLCPDTGKEFDVLGMTPGLPVATLVSDRFDVGRAFCTKVWNAARFAFMNLEDVGFEPRALTELPDEDRWLLSRLSRARAEVQRQLEAYNPSAAVGAARSFFWSELCDWYLELIKPRLRDAASAPLARQVLAAALDQVLRLLHPFVPFITEELWEQLGKRAPLRGIEQPFEVAPLLVGSIWPDAHEAWQDDALEARVGFAQDLIHAIRGVRSKYDVPPRKQIEARIRATPAAFAPAAGLEPLIQHMAGISSLEIGPDAARSADAATVVVRELQIYLGGVIDVEKERARLVAQRDKLRKAVESGRAKLAKPGFAERAPAAVVATERERLAQAELELTEIERSLEQVG
jgi:valyl-tRNA synthetase